MRSFLKILVALLVVVVALGVRLVYSQFLIYQDSVDRILSALPPEERHISSTPAAQVMETLDGRSVQRLASRGLLLEVITSPTSPFVWNVRGALWALLLPLRISRPDMLGLYAHYMAFEGGTGLSYGARKYYAKVPSALTIEESVALITISRGPDRYSPQRRPEEYERLYRKLLAQYRSGG